MQCIRFAKCGADTGCVASRRGLEPRMPLTKLHSEPPSPLITCPTVTSQSPPESSLAATYEVHPGPQLAFRMRLERSVLTCGVPRSRHLGLQRCYTPYSFAVRCLVLT
eukprot:3121731-Rhodomonas_salina.1